MQKISFNDIINGCDDDFNKRELHSAGNHDGDKNL